MKRGLGDVTTCICKYSVFQKYESTSSKQGSMQFCHIFIIVSINFITNNSIILTKVIADSAKKLSGSNV